MQLHLRSAHTACFCLLAIPAIVLLTISHVRHQQIDILVFFFFFLSLCPESFRQRTYNHTFRQSQCVWYSTVIHRPRPRPISFCGSCHCSSQYAGLRSGENDSSGNKGKLQGVMRAALPCQGCRYLYGYTFQIT